jgi:hypothetical protein
MEGEDAKYIAIESQKITSHGAIHVWVRIPLGLLFFK